MLNHSLDFAVQQLVSIPLGGSVVIGVNHPLPGTQELDNELGSPYPLEDQEREEETSRSLEVGVAKWNIQGCIIHSCQYMCDLN